ncbi:uncharacterized protein SAPINGB_P003586 [Magnusiomyces paraingens]|uniref:Uncharacterized protein n=1 Tax=Magnusiomyces paraingens TaxID=2606893 RepID=A0A5E8BQ34_9ASCO|nr:uncharacterized protein SAPINGB_P003586 [Saprochaete ingens]VVT53463.1 unnamed protein product [Saprochaete ingens]
MDTSASNDSNIYRYSHHAPSPSYVSIGTDITSSADSFYSAEEGSNHSNENEVFTNSPPQNIEPQSRFQAHSNQLPLSRASVASTASYAFSFSAYESAAEDDLEPDFSRHSRALSISTVTDHEIPAIAATSKKDSFSTNDNSPNPVKLSQNSEPRFSTSTQDDRRQTLLPSHLLQNTQQVESEVSDRPTQKSNGTTVTQFSSSSADIDSCSLSSQSTTDGSILPNTIESNNSFDFSLKSLPDFHLHKSSSDLKLAAGNSTNSAFSEIISQPNSVDPSIANVPSPKSTKPEESLLHTPQSVRKVKSSSPTLHHTDFYDAKKLGSHFTPKHSKIASSNSQDFVFNDNFDNTRSPWQIHQKSLSDEKTAFTSIPLSASSKSVAKSLSSGYLNQTLVASDSNTSNALNSTLSNSTSFSSTNANLTSISGSPSEFDFDFDFNDSNLSGHSPYSIRSRRYVQDSPHLKMQDQNSVLVNNFEEASPDHEKTERLNSDLPHNPNFKFNEEIINNKTHAPNLPPSVSCPPIPKESLKGESESFRPVRSSLLSETSCYSDTIPQAIVHPARKNMHHVYRSRSSFSDTVSPKSDSLYENDPSSPGSNIENDIYNKDGMNFSPDATQSETTPGSGNLKSSVVQVPVYSSPNIDSFSKFPYRNSQMPGKLSATSSPDTAEKAKFLYQPISAFVTTSDPNSTELEENSFPLQIINNNTTTYNSNTAKKINNNFFLDDAAIFSSSTPQAFFAATALQNPFTYPSNNLLFNTKLDTNTPANNLSNSPPSPTKPGSGNANSSSSLKFVRFNDSSLVSLMERKDVDDFYQDQSRSKSLPNINRHVIRKHSNDKLGVNSLRNSPRNIEFPSSPPMARNSSPNKSVSPTFALNTISNVDINNNTDTYNTIFNKNNGSGNNFETPTRESRASSKNSRYSQHSAISRHSRTSRNSRSSRNSQRFSKSSQHSQSSTSSLSSYLLNTQNLMQSMLRSHPSNSSLRQSLVSTADDIHEDFENYENTVMGSVNVTEPEEMIVTTKVSPVPVFAVQDAASSAILPNLPPTIAPPDAPIPRPQPAMLRKNSRDFDLSRHTFSGINLSNEDDANLAATARAANVITEKRSEKFGEKNEVIDEYGNVLCPPMLEWFLLFAFALFPLFWLLLACGVFDKAIGKVSKRTKIIALVLAIILFVAAIAGLIVGLAVGLT